MSFSPKSVASLNFSSEGEAVILLLFIGLINQDTIDRGMFICLFGQRVLKSCKFYSRRSERCAALFACDAGFVHFVVSSYPDAVFISRRFSYLKIT